jgi:Peptidase family M50
VSALVNQPLTSSTPILDRLSSLPKAKTRWLEQAYEIFIAILTVYGPILFIGILVVYGPIFLLAKAPSPVLEWISRNLQTIYRVNWAGARSFIATFLTAVVIVMVLIVHEAGHVLAGVAVGFRWKHVRVGRIQLDRSLRFSQTSGAESLGGTLFFAEEMKGRRLKCIVVLASGPLANLLSGLLVLILPGQKSLVAGLFIAVSFYSGVINLIPFPGRGVGSDGLKIWRALFRQRNHERFIALALLGQQMRSSLEDIDYEMLSPALIAEATAIRDDSLATVLAHEVAYFRAFCLKDNSTAEHCLETCLLFSRRYSSAMRTELIGEAAIFQAKRRKRIDLARQWLADLPNDEVGKSLRPRVEGNIAEAEGQFEQALLKVEICQKQAERIANEQTRNVRMARLAKWKEEIEQSQAKAQGV